MKITKKIEFEITEICKYDEDGNVVIYFHVDNSSIMSTDKERSYEPISDFKLISFNITENIRDYDDMLTMDDSYLYTEDAPEIFILFGNRDGFIKEMIPYMIEFCKENKIPNMYFGECQGRDVYVSVNKAIDEKVNKGSTLKSDKNFTVDWEIKDEMLYLNNIYLDVPVVCKLDELGKGINEYKDKWNSIIDGKYIWH